jgi:rhamnulokinase/L-fuculokinase
MEYAVLAFDLGASSGRAVLGFFDGERIKLAEAHRFDNDPVLVRGMFHWDVLRLFHEIKLGMQKAKSIAEFKTVGIDTWGVDFGLLDKDGNLLQNPVHYRDRRTGGIPEKFFESVMPRGELYNRTGVQVMDINTIFQLKALAVKQPELLKLADCALLMPDLLAYMLTGVKNSEYTAASTTQLINPYTGEWDDELFGKIGARSGLFPDVRQPGRPLGPLDGAIARELGLPDVEVISVAGHDTASAVVAVPADEEDFIYISCGTWSLFGTELAAPNISDKSMALNITNEGGYGGTIRFLKNISGLWLIQETRRQYRREGREYSYNELERHALAAEPFASFIDPDAPEFAAPGDIPARVREYCEKTGQRAPGTVGQIMRCVYESIALKYRFAYDMVRECTGKSYGRIHIVGGGAKDNLLCQMTANATGSDVTAGPIEATALGNIAVQLIAKGLIKDLSHARKVIMNSFEPVRYSPRDGQAGLWRAAFERYRRIAY